MAKAKPFAARLSAFCKANRTVGGVRCHTCALDKETLDAIRAESKKGSPFSLIARALRAEGHQIKEGTLRNHFRNCEQRTDGQR